MQFQLRVASSRQESELRSLQGWLSREPATRAAVVSQGGQAPAPGSMGQLFDVLELVTGNGWSAASFVLSVLTWRQTRPRPPRVVIRRGDVEISLAEGSEEEVRAMVAALEQGDDGPRPAS
ncbi:effector-associated constant component EACC1 [Streptomyces sp. bgisy027]|uniref:effector-associated constant component EACC1 n=1 Tax=Streptomyces sp. bgisy027 TaxID=3413770 RepID=UPI003D72D659